MPGRLFLTRSKEAFTAATGLPMPDGYQPRHNIAPQQSLMVWRDGQAKLEEMRWGILPVGRVNARGRPVVETLVNIRSETFAEKSAFEGMKRAVVPVDGWYEWTGEKRNKKHGGFSVRMVRCFGLRLCVIAGPRPVARLCGRLRPSRLSPTQMWPQSTIAWARC